MKRLLAISIFCLLSFAVIPSDVSAGKLVTPPINTGLLARWSFDEGSGLTVNDTSGNNRTGTSTLGAFWSARGQLGAAGEFDGTNDYISIADDAAFAFGTSLFTISMWVNFDSVNTAGTGPAFITQNTGGGTTPKWIFLYPGATSGAPVGDRTRTAFHVNNTGQGSGCWASSAAWTPTVGRWYHIAVVRLSSTLYQFYRDGVPDGSDTCSLSVPDVASTIRIAQSEDNFYLDGRIDETRVYNRALSADEIANLYESKTRFATTPDTVRNGLTGHWTFDGRDIASGTIRDRMRTATGTVSGIASSTFYTPGTLGQALRFDGSNDYLTMGNAFDQTGASAFSIAVWFRATTTDNVTRTFVSKASMSPPYAGYTFGLNQVLDSSPGKVGFVLSDGVPTIMRRQTVTSTYNDGRWHQATVVYDGSKTIAGVTIYVDGERQATTDADSASFAGSLTSTTHFQIGSRETTNQLFNGMLDDVRFYNRALSATEAKRLYAMGAGTVISDSLPSLDTSLAAHWTFDGRESLAGVAGDRTTGNNGSFFNIATSTFFSLGRIGQAVTYDGTDDYVLVSDAAELSATTGAADRPLSVSAWIRPTSIATDRMIISKRDESVANGCEWWFGYGSTYVNYSFGDGTNSANRIGMFAPALTENQWTHVVGTYDGSGSSSGVRIYFNGVRVDTTNTNAGSYVRTRDSAASVYVGAWRSGAGTISGVHTGGLDDVRIYNKNLTSDEVSRLYVMGR